MASILYRRLFVLSIFFSISFPSFAIDKKDFINRAGLMMMAPCMVQPYLDCIQVKQADCKQAVKHAGKECSTQVPHDVSEKNSSHIMQSLGRCMSAKIIVQLELTPEKINTCRPLLHTRHTEKP